jgi:hypothetical protein
MLAKPERLGKNQHRGPLAGFASIEIQVALELQTIRLIFQNFSVHGFSSRGTFDPART